ncbi:SDR family oxidoreductase [Croceibacterium ferulae]|uniref:SDR family oxidoreductase n=1 Tax=Croceibacterium ferulae TaxID=1854641 RepID=UPI000EB144CA|nr:SDR family oxidoreductase [Croceibacterium ferulae]
MITAPPSADRPAVLVTGGARRIGAAIVRGFADAGWHVIIHSHRSTSAARALADALPSAEVVTADLGDTDACATLVDSLAAHLPDWRVLVNNAARFGPARDTADALATFRLNALAPWTLADRFLRLPPLAGGRRVIHLTDQKVAHPNPDFPHYTMAKHALAGVVAGQQMAQDQAGRPQDRVYALAPGAILASLDQSEAEADRTHRLNLLRRRVTLPDMADAALFLATGPLAGGQTLFADCGQHLLRQPRDVIFLAEEPAEPA